MSVGAIKYVIGYVMMFDRVCKRVCEGMYSRALEVCDGLSPYLRVP